MNFEHDDAILLIYSHFRYKLIFDQNTNDLKNNLSNKHIKLKGLFL